LERAAADHRRSHAGAAGGLGGARRRRRDLRTRRQVRLRSHARLLRPPGHARGLPYAFDLLELDDRDLRSETWARRRTALAQLLADADVNVLDLLLIEAGAFYIMDRGYLDFERLYALDQAGGFFITRAKRNLDARRVYSAPVDRDTGLICDQTIALNGFYAAKHYPAYLRRIRYRDPQRRAAAEFGTVTATINSPGARTVSRSGASPGKR
jgi:hypothetical protein